MTATEIELTRRVEQFEKVLMAIVLGNPIGFDKDGNMVAIDNPLVRTISATAKPLYFGPPSR